jgi:hypothetical protein
MIGTERYVGTGEPAASRLSATGFANISCQRDDTFSASTRFLPRNGIAALLAVNALDSVSSEMWAKYGAKSIAMNR